MKLTFFRDYHVFSRDYSVNKQQLKLIDIGFFSCCHIEHGTMITYKQSGLFLFRGESFLTTCLAPAVHHKFVHPIVMQVDIAKG